MHTNGPSAVILISIVFIHYSLIIGRTILVWFDYSKKMAMIVQLMNRTFSIVITPMAKILL